MFGRKLRQFREDRQMTLRQLGEIAGQDYIILNKIELGLRLPPPLEGIMALADALKLKRNEFEELLNLAAEDNGKAGSRFTEKELSRIKQSRIAEVFFTRRVSKQKEE